MSVATFATVAVALASLVWLGLGVADAVGEWVENRDAESFLFAGLVVVGGVFAAAWLLWP